MLCLTYYWTIVYEAPDAHTYKYYKEWVMVMFAILQGKSLQQAYRQVWIHRSQNDLTLRIATTTIRTDYLKYAYVHTGSNHYTGHKLRTDSYNKVSQVFVLKGKLFVDDIKVFVEAGTLVSIVVYSCLVAVYCKQPVSCSVPLSVCAIEMHVLHLISTQPLFTILQHFTCHTIQLSSLEMIQQTASYYKQFSAYMFQKTNITRRQIVLCALLQK